MLKVRKSNFLFVSVILALVFSFTGITAFAGGSDILIAINGEQQTFEQKPILKDGRTLVPLRAISEFLGAKVDFSSALKGIIVYNNRKCLAFCVDGTEIDYYNIKNNEQGGNSEIVDSTRKKMDVLPVILDGRVYVPLRIISEGLGAEIKWIQETRTVDINYSYLGEKIEYSLSAADMKYPQDKATPAPIAVAIPTPAPTVITLTNPDTHAPIPGFKAFEADGFKIQLPIGWEHISSKVKYKTNGSEDSFSSTKYPIEKEYTIRFSTFHGVHCQDVSIYITPDMPTRSISITDHPSKIRNADTSYVLKKFEDSAQSDSFYDILATRGNVYYYISGLYYGDRTDNGIKMYKEVYRKFLTDMEKMVSSFELSDTPASFNQIVNNKEIYMSLEN